MTIILDTSDAPYAETSALQEVVNLVAERGLGEGTTVLVRPGTYPGPLLIHGAPGLTLAPTSWAEATTTPIIASESGVGVHIVETDGVTVLGFKVTVGPGTGTELRTGLVATAAKGAVFKGNVVVVSGSGEVVGIHLENSEDALVSDNQITAVTTNVTTPRSTGVLIHSGAHNSVSNNSIGGSYQGQEPQGALPEQIGIAVKGSQNTLMDGNQVDGTPVGIALLEGSTGSLITRNTITNVQIAILARGDSSPNSINWNNLFGAQEWGVLYIPEGTSAGVVPLDASYNWWGDRFGPAGAGPGGGGGGGTP